MKRKNGKAHREKKPRQKRTKPKKPAEETYKKKKNRPSPEDDELAVQLAEDYKVSRVRL